MKIGSPIYIYIYIYICRLAPTIKSIISDQNSRSIKPKLIGKPRNQKDPKLIYWQVCVCCIALVVHFQVLYLMISFLSCEVV